MADSDDEYDRKRRDKFRGERAEASYRGTERVARPRDDWAERYTEVIIHYFQNLNILLQGNLVSSKTKRISEWC